MEFPASFFDTSYILYIFGFLFFPRITFMYSLMDFVSGGFKFRDIFAPISIWFAYPELELTFLSKLGISLGALFMPRVLLAILGLMIFEERLFFAFAIIFGFMLDSGNKYIFVQHGKKNRRD